MAAPADLLEIAERLIGRPCRYIGTFAQGGGGVFRLEDTTTGNRFVLKQRHMSATTLRQLREHLRWAEVLRSVGWPLPQVLATSQVEDHVVSLERYIEGEHPDGITAAVVESMLSLPGRAHEYSAPVPDWFSSLRAHFDAGTESRIQPEVLWEHRVGHEVIESAERSFREIPPGLQVRDIVHGDFSPGNAIVLRGELSGIIDWDDARPGDASFDIAALEWDIAMWGRGVRHLLPQITARLNQDSRPAIVSFYRAYWAAWNLTWAIGTTDEQTVSRTWRAMSE